VGPYAEMIVIGAAWFSVIAMHLLLIGCTSRIVLSNELAITMATPCLWCVFTVGVFSTEMTRIFFSGLLVVRPDVGALECKDHDPSSATRQHRLLNIIKYSTSSTMYTSEIRRPLRKK
jgi:hypothetical protein